MKGSERARELLVQALADGLINESLKVPMMDRDEE